MTIMIREHRYTTNQDLTVYAEQQTYEIMRISVRGETLYSSDESLSASVVSRYFNGNWRASAEELLRAPTHATCTPIDW